MRQDDGATPHFLAEWYSQQVDERGIADLAARLREASATMPCQSVRPAVLYAVHVPEDAYAFAMFTAASADLVTRACREAGTPADRVTAAREATPFDRPAG